VYEVKDDDITLSGFSKSAQSTIMKMETALADLSKRLDAMDAHLGDIKGGMFSDLERLAKNNAQVVEYWQRHNERLK
jgi:hypothetical protein